MPLLSATPKILRNKVSSASIMCSGERPWTLNSTRTFSVEELVTAIVIFSLLGCSGAEQQHCIMDCSQLGGHIQNLKPPDDPSNDFPESSSPDNDDKGQILR